MFFASEMRASDADREAAADFLKRHYTAGRLSEDELTARVDAVYRATFDSQLDALTADLPAIVAPAPAPRRLSRLGPAATGVAILAVMLFLAAAIPDEAWAMLVLLGIPVLMVIVFTIAPIALPVLGVVWLVRTLNRPRQPRMLPSSPYRPERPGGWRAV